MKKSITAVLLILASITSVSAQEYVKGVCFFGFSLPSGRDIVLNSHHVSQITRGEDSPDTVQFYTRDENFSMVIEDTDAVKKITALMTTCQIKLGKDSPFRETVKTVQQSSVQTNANDRKKIH